MKEEEFEELQINEFYININKTLIIQYLGNGQAKVIMTNLTQENEEDKYNKSRYPTIYYRRQYVRVWEVGAIIHLSPHIYDTFTIKYGLKPYWIKY